jgi:glycosyltransferase involved in cell wall biosynthesis
VGGCVSRNRYYYQYLWRRINIFLVKKRVSTIITPSMALKKALTNYGLESIHIPNYVVASKFIASQYIPGTKNVLFAGHLFSSKGVHNLIKAFKNVSARIPAAKLDIVGDGPEREKLQQLAVSLKIQNSVIFHRAVPHADLPSFYARANVVVLPSVVAENCPLVVLEAMASARPVLGSRLGGIPELISENESGLLFTPNDADGLCEKIIDVLSDPELAAQMGQCGRQRIEREYSYEEHIRRISDLYIRLKKCNDKPHEPSSNVLNCSLRRKRQ